MHVLLGRFDCFYRYHSPVGRTGGEHLHEGEAAVVALQLEGLLDEAFRLERLLRVVDGAARDVGRRLERGGMVIDTSGSMGWFYETEENEYPQPGTIARVLLGEIADELTAADRIATFDNDGTLWTEKPLYVHFYAVMAQMKAQMEGDPLLHTREPYRAIASKDLGYFMELYENAAYDSLAGQLFFYGFGSGQLLQHLPQHVGRLQVQARVGFV